MRQKSEPRYTLCVGLTLAHECGWKVRITGEPGGAFWPVEFTAGVHEGETGSYHEGTLLSDWTPYKEEEEGV